MKNENSSCFFNKLQAYCTSHPSHMLILIRRRCKIKSRLTVICVERLEELYGKVDRYPVLRSMLNSQNI